jgi:hypothetical protein
MEDEGAGVWPTGKLSSTGPQPTSDHQPTPVEHIHGGKSNFNPIDLTQSFGSSGDSSDGTRSRSSTEGLGLDGGSDDDDDADDADSSDDDTRTSSMSLVEPMYDNRLCARISEHFVR